MKFIGYVICLRMNYPRKVEAEESSITIELEGKNGRNGKLTLRILFAELVQFDDEIWGVSEYGILAW